MGYYMRYFSTDSQAITLDQLESALREIDENYAIAERDHGTFDYGVLTHAGDPYGEITLNLPGDGLFDEEIGAFRESIADLPIETRALVAELLDNTKTIVAVRVLNLNRESEDVLSRIDPLWDWLSANRKGLLQADGEGFYDGENLILELK